MTISGKHVWLLLALPLAGCAWRTDQADHVFGPTVYRFRGTSPGNSAVFQTFHAPLLLEGGRQWGLSVGGVQRLALVAKRGEAETALQNAGEPPRGWLIHPAPDHWRFSLFYLRAPLHEPPVFIRRSVLGATGGAGMEERTLSFGYSSMTATNPREDAVYQLDFDSRHPLDATLVVNPAVNPKTSTPTPSPQ